MSLERQTPPRSRFYRALLRLLPFDFRSEHGRDMEQVFHAGRREARAEGTLRAVVRLWVEALQDLFTTAPRQHIELVGRTSATRCGR